jgi:preprotein translocase subunit YajC
MCRDIVSDELRLHQASLGASNWYQSSSHGDAATAFSFVSMTLFVKFVAHRPQRTRKAQAIVRVDDALVGARSVNTRGGERGSKT